MNPAMINKIKKMQTNIGKFFKKNKKIFLGLFANWFFVLKS